MPGTVFTATTDAAGVVTVLNGPTVIAILENRQDAIILAMYGYGATVRFI